MSFDNPFRLKNSPKASGNAVGEILIYGGIGEWAWSEEKGWYEQNLAVDIRAQLNELASSCGVINIRINSPGGFVDEGIAIVNAIIQCPVPVHIYIDGLAASMAAIIALAGAKVHAASNSLFMFHNVSGWSYGNAKDMLKAHEVWSKWDSTLATTIAERTTLSEDEISERFLNYEDNFFTAAEALELGLIDEILGLEAQGMPNEPTAMSHTQLAAWYRTQDAKPPQPATRKAARLFKKRNTPTNTSPMDLKALKAAIKDGTIKLSAEAQEKILAEAGGYEKQITDLTAERDSAIEARDTAITAKSEADSNNETLKNVRTALGASEEQDLVDVAKKLRDSANKPVGQVVPEAPEAPEEGVDAPEDDVLSAQATAASKKLKNMGY